MKTREELLERIVELQEQVMELTATQEDYLTIVKLGNENWKPTDEDIKAWQEQVLDAGIKGKTIVTHSLIDIQKVRI